MTLLDSLLDAIVRLEGDALVMHVGEKPYVVTTSSSMNAFRGPLAWGQVELSSRVLTPDAVLGMLGQILPLEQRQSLEEVGAIEHEIPSPAGSEERFTVVAARGGDDVWLEVRRHPKVEARPAVVEPAPVPVEPEAVSDEPVFTGVTEDDDEDFEQVVEHEISFGEGGTATVQPLARTSATDDEVQSTPEADVEDEHEEPIYEIGVGASARDDVPAVPATPAGLELVIEESQTTLTDADVDALFAASAAALLKRAKPEPETPFEEPATEAAREPEPITAEPPVEPITEPVQEPVVEPEPEYVAEPVLAHVEAAPEPMLPEAQASPIEEEKEPESEPAFVLIGEPPSPSPELVAEEDASVPDAMPHPTFAFEQARVEPPSLTIAARAPVEAPVPAPRPSQEAKPVVVPLARRPMRPDTMPAPSRLPTLTAAEEILRIAAARGASTVYVVAGAGPMVRADGEISSIDVEPLTASDVERMAIELAAPTSRDAGGEWMADVAEVGRVRCLTFHDHRGPGLILQMISPQALSADQLGLTPEVQALCGQSDGLVVVTGPRGSGKSTLMSAFVDLVNRTRSDHVITIESQIEFAHQSRRSFISQREIRGDASAVVAAIRAALREDPDVLLIEDLRSAEVATAALEAAESGRLVLGSLTAATTFAAIDKLIELYPAERRAQTQTSLATALRGVVSQVLVRRQRGGRMAAREVLLNTPAVAALIQDGKTAQLPLAIESGRRHGMMPLNDSLAALVRDGTVHVSEAYRKALEKESLLAALKREGIDTSFAERLA